MSNIGVLFIATFSFGVFLCYADFPFLPRIAQFNNGQLVDHFGSLAPAAKVLLQKAEVVLVGDISVAIQVDDLEDHADVGLLRSELHEGERILDGLCEFGQVHHALAAPVVGVFAMQTLDGDFPEVLLHAEVDQLVVLDLAIVIVVVPENVFDEVEHLRAILVEDLFQKVLYFLLLELLVPVVVEFNHLQVSRLSHLERQLVRGELEPVLLACSWLQLDEFSTLLFPLPLTAP